MSVAALHRDTAFQARSLFRSLLRTSSQFSNYNFREYARRKTRDMFREHQKVSEERRIQELMQEGLQSLRLMKRQTIISQFYQLDKLVVEGQETGKETGGHGEIVRQKDTGYFRSSRSGRQLDSNRSRTGQIDHDVFEGLPVRRWSRQPHTVSQAPKTEETEFGQQGAGGVNGLPELPMPRDSQLLPAASRALLRAARAGCIYIRSSGRGADEEEKPNTDAEDQAASNANLADRSFTSRKWMSLPKHMEPPEVEFLAKRRPGLPSLYGGPVGVDGSVGVTPGPMRRTKFQKVDAETGNISIYEAWVPEGHRIEGEVTGDMQVISEQSEVPVKPEAPAPGTVVEGVGIVNSEGVVVADASSAAVSNPNKRRPPPPKRKGKGTGKGRKKKVMFAPGEGADAATVHGVVPGAGDVNGGGEGQDASQMSIDQSGQDEEDDEGEDGDESDEGEGDESMIDAKTPETPQPQPIDGLADKQSADPAIDQERDVEMADAIPESHPVSEPSIAAEKEEPSPIPPVQTETPANDTDASASASASATLAPPVEKAEQSTTDPSEPPKEPLGDENAIHTEDTAPKEDTSEPAPTSLAGAEDKKESPVTGDALHITDEIKTEPQTAQSGENSPLPPVSPEAPAEREHSEQPQLEQPKESSAQPESANDAPQPPTENPGQTQPLPTTEENSTETSQAPVEKEDVEMGDASNPTEQLAPQEPASEPQEKAASPAPASIDNAEPTTQPPAEAPVAEASQSKSDTEPKAEETPTAEGGSGQAAETAQSDADSETKKEESDTLAPAADAS
ncbi:LYR family protein [Penicillium argentinense]|uniref:LYR family protein n=1 Tax=Penicillium argentinense TaxID=1131581 RepID=A0A9W9KMD0_9EURO|nr:LYR family protein [Penicillium argentinense]KAJ5110818.1 LYR family protein [Penicillium argentinense]